MVGGRGEQLCEQRQECLSIAPNDPPVLKGECQSPSESSSLHNLIYVQAPIGLPLSLATSALTCLFIGWLGLNPMRCSQPT